MHGWFGFYETRKEACRKYVYLTLMFCARQNSRGITTALSESNASNSKDLQRVLWICFCLLNELLFETNSEMFGLVRVTIFFIVHALHHIYLYSKDVWQCGLCITLIFY